MAYDIRYGTEIGCCGTSNRGNIGQLPPSALRPGPSVSPSRDYSSAQKPTSYPLPNVSVEVLDFEEGPARWRLVYSGSDCSLARKIERSYRSLTYSVRVSGCGIIFQENGVPVDLEIGQLPPGALGPAPPVLPSPDRIQPYPASQAPRIPPGALTPPTLTVSAIPQLNIYLQRLINLAWNDRNALYGLIQLWGKTFAGPVDDTEYRAFQEVNNRYRTLLVL